MAHQQSDGTVYCSYEPGRWPLGEFFEDPEHGTVHYLKVEALHTTTGEVINVQQIPGVAIRIEDALKHDVVEKIPAVGAMMRERFGAETVADLRNLE